MSELELCELISNDLDKKVYFSNGDILLCENCGAVILDLENGIWFNCDTLKPDTVIAIGNFYKERENKK